MTGLHEELQSGLEQWIQDEGKVSELITKLALEPMQLSLLEMFALSKMAKVPLSQFTAGLIDKWPEYVWIDELADEFPQVLSYLKKSKAGKSSKKQ